MSLSFQDMANLKLDDIIYEYEYGYTIKARVVIAPVVADDGYEGRRTVRWTAFNDDTNVSIEYLCTEGLEHYGPKVYFDDPVFRG